MECEIAPEAAVITTALEAGVEVLGITVKTEVDAPPLGITVVGLKVQLAPVGHETLRATGWLNALTGETVTVEVAGVPVLTGDGERAVAAIVKSGAAA